MDTTTDRSVQGSIHKGKRAGDTDAFSASVIAQIPVFQTQRGDRVLWRPVWGHSSSIACSIACGGCAVFGHPSSIAYGDCAMSGEYSSITLLRSSFVLF